jgi:hypothetical protein
MKRSETIVELVTALAKAQGQITGAIKDAENPHFKSDYATLDSVWEACRAPLSSNGLSVIQSPRITEAGSVRITTLLAHNSGQWFENELEMMPKDGSPQSVGSAITYGRRYALSALVGIAPADDDDGNSATPPQGQRPAVGQKGAPPATDPPKPLAEPGLYTCKFGQKYKGIALRDIAAADLRGYVKYLRDSASLEKKKLGGSVLEFVVNADAYLIAQDPSSFQNASAALEPGGSG